MSEAEKAQAGREEGPTIFDKILDGSIPAKFIHDDDKCVAFNDVSPQAPVHFLVIPRKRIAMIEEAEDADAELLGHLLLVAKKVAKEQGLTNGYRCQDNNMFRADNIYIQARGEQREGGSSVCVSSPHSCDGRKTDELASRIISHESSESLQNSFRTTNYTPL